MTEFLQYFRNGIHPETVQNFEKDSELAQFLGTHPAENGDGASSSLDNSGSETNYFPENHITSAVPTIPGPLAK